MDSNEGGWTVRISVTNCIFVDSRAMVCMLFQLRPYIEGSFTMACFMVLEHYTFQMEANMKECGTMVLQSQ